MSESAHRVRSEPDRIATPRLFAIAGVTLAIFLGASLVTGWGLEAVRRQVLPQGPAPLPAEVGQPKIGMLDQQPFATARTGEEWAAAQRRRLESYGWVDRPAGLVHVPIEQAMERVLRGERP